MGKRTPLPIVIPINNSVIPTKLQISLIEALGI
jgi:hypothetical protein